MNRPRRLALAALTVAGILHPPAPAFADHTQTSLFQDDDHLVYAAPASLTATLATLKGIGVQQLRVTVKWSDIAPAADATTRPPGFNASDPAAYPPTAWNRYDQLAQRAASFGLAVQFNLTAPGPLWAMHSGAPSARAADHWQPDAGEFGSFATAVAVRYSGRYGGLPRVSSWSIWNEPNQPGWLAPQSIAIRGRQVPLSARMYRDLVRAGYRGLLTGSHSPAHDTILVGELAPEGSLTPGSYEAMTPMPFLRALYCVDPRYRRLRGRAARTLGCPLGGSRRTFVKQNSLLFSASAFAHHPYYFFRAPAVRSPERDFVPLANLNRLERGLDRIFIRYGVRRRIPLQLTEYGYQTNPPDPFQVVTPAAQSVYLDQADFIAWRDPRVRALSQFLLYDAGPDPRFAPTDFGYWDTFQTGLLFSDGTPKPAFSTYQLPIWVPRARVRRKGRLLIWGHLRAAQHPGADAAQLQWSTGASGPFATVAHVIARNPNGYFTARVRVPRSGWVRIAASAAGGAPILSRVVAVSVG